MAHSLSIAKASLLASCLRPDCTKLSRDDLAHFHDLLESSIKRCSPSNIQNTKSWLLQHILPSSTRTLGLNKYLTTLSKNIVALPTDTTPPRACRQRLHILYLINDLLHHVTHHSVGGSIRQHVGEQLVPSLPGLFANAASDQKPRTIRRLHDLVQIWDSGRYCDAHVLTELRHVLSSGRSEEAMAEPTEVKTSKELPWVMPATHGDPSAPFFDLPAANLMPHIVPNSSRPLRPSQIRALQLTAGLADESLVNAMKDFLRDINSIDDPYAALEEDGNVVDIDEMGQISYKNEADDVVGDTYYGWSRAFCEKMKNRGNDEGNKARGRLRSSESSRSTSRSPIKRRRYSSSRSMSRSRSRSRSMSRSPSRHVYRARSPSLSGSAPQRRTPPRGPTQPSNPSQPPRFQSAQLGHLPQQNHQPPPPPPPPVHHSGSAHPFQPPQIGIARGLPLPPRPPGWQGLWPPPPPPAGGFPVSMPNMQFPPPPPGNFNQQNNHHQRGYGRH